jgi:chromosome segregation ATPase
MRGHLEGIKTRLQTVDDLTDQLGKERDQLERETQEAAEFAELTGQTAQTRQALDASTSVVTQAGQQVGAVSDSVAEAQDQVAAAVDGLRVVEEAEDGLVSAGADGRAVAPAGVGA